MVSWMYRMVWESIWIFSFMVPVLKDDEFFHSKVIRDFDVFAEMADVIVANRMDERLKGVEDKVYTRDIYHKD